jgi:hypothetical protein
MGNRREGEVVREKRKEAIPAGRLEEVEGQEIRGRVWSYGEGEGDARGLAVCDGLKDDERQTQVSYAFSKG